MGCTTDTVVDDKVHLSVYFSIRSPFELLHKQVQLNGYMSMEEPNQWLLIAFLLHC